MTQEEKAKAYDEAIERAKKQLDGAKVFDYDNEQIAHDIRTTVYNIFPELKDKYLPQQKQEWSEEDKGTLERIIYFINSFVDKDLGEVVLNEEIFTDDAQQELKRYVDFLRNIENIKN